MARDFLQSFVNHTCQEHSIFNASYNHTWEACNKTSNSSSGSLLADPWKISYAMRILLMSLYAIVFIVGASGNSLVCFIIGRKRRLSGGDTFIISLAVADLLASICVPLVIIPDLSTGSNKWHYGAAMCKILPSVSPATLVASSWSLMLIAMDRYRVITSPLQARLSLAMKLTGIFITWIFAIGITMPYTLSQGLDIQHSICIDQGIFNPIGINIYVTIWIIAGWVIPFVAISILYGLCIEDLKSGATIANSTAKQRKAENRKVIHMFIIIVSIFFTFTTPYSIFYVTLNYLLTYNRSNVNVNLIMKLNYALFFLTNVNSCMNPLIYAKLHKDVNGYLRRKWSQMNCVKTNKTQRKNSYQVSEITERSMTTGTSQSSVFGHFSTVSKENTIH